MSTDGLTDGRTDGQKEGRTDEPKTIVPLTFVGGQKWRNSHNTLHLNCKYVGRILCINMLYLTEVY